MRLLTKQELSAQSLARMLGVSAAAIRQHLETLNALGLVTRRKLVTKPSRPTYLYRLSRRGAETFPKRYDLLISLLTEVIRERDGEHGVTDVVQAAAERLTLQLRTEFATAETDRRWQLLIEWFETELAWHADVVADADGQRRVTIHQCPFQAVSRQQPSVCGAFFRTLIQRLYEPVSVDHVPLADGVACCELVVNSNTDEVRRRSNRGVGKARQTMLSTQRDMDARASGEAHSFRAGHSALES